MDISHGKISAYANFGIISQKYVRPFVTSQKAQKTYNQYFKNNGAKCRECRR